MCLSPSTLQSLTFSSAIAGGEGSHTGAIPVTFTSICIFKCASFPCLTTDERPEFLLLEFVLILNILNTGTECLW